jgi:FdhD protein
MITPQKAIHYERYEFKKWKPLDTETIVESPVSLTVNGRVWLTFMCTPVDLEAMSVGFLYNEGMIESMEEVEDVRVCEHGDNVDVWLNHSVEQPQSWRRTSGCTGGMTAVDALARVDVSFNGRWPTVQPATPEPTASMIPATSCPGTRGY